MLFLLFACQPSTIIGGEDSTASGDSSASGDTAETGEAPRDLDADGYPAGTDCMDLNADVHPGATETWNGLDDDCDGVTDAEGAWSGAVNVQATAVYEGHPYSYVLDCPIVGTRAGGQFPFTVTCTPESSNEREVLLLGEWFTLTPEDATVGDEQSWSGTVIMTASAGWDTDASGSVSWSSLKAATFSASLDAYSLSLSASGSLSRD